MLRSVVADRGGRHTGHVPSRVRLARDRARAEVTAEILAIARGQLGEVGAAGLSLRAVARELGTSPSALFRYVESKDALLTRLLVASFDDLGEAAEAAERAVHDETLARRWSAICHAVRDWALAHPHEYALLYGSPVPGYVAPQDTVGPATRVPRLLIGLLVELVAPEGRGADEDAAAAARGAADASADPALHAALAPLRTQTPAAVPDALLARGLMAWTHLFGAVSFEVFGHRTFDVLDDPATFFDRETDLIAHHLGLTTP
jgi:AcrR family transcriptional regulator